jgi:hypothetical protein
MEGRLWVVKGDSCSGVRSDTVDFIINGDETLVKELPS